MKFFFLLFFLHLSFFSPVSAQNLQDDSGDSTQRLLSEIEQSKTKKVFYSRLQDPLFMDNQQLLFRVFGIPAFESAQITPHLQFSVRYSIRVSNEYYYRSTKVKNFPQKFKELIRFDYEALENSLSFRFGLWNRIELGVDYKYLSISGGKLDSFVDQFHTLFRLSEGGRNKVPNQRLILDYRRNGKSLVFVENSFDSEQTDVLLTLGWRLLTSEDEYQNFSFKFRYKLPVGNYKRFFGSGKPDYGGEFSYSNTNFLTEGLAFHTVLGGMLLGNFELINPNGGNYQQDFVVYNYYALNYLFFNSFSFKTSIHFNTPYYQNSEIVALKSYNAQAVLGLGFKLNDSLVGEFGLSEDPITSTAPDFTIFLNLRYAI